MKVLSLVIPTYNMEKYLNNCLDSFIYDKETQEIEVLIVNDGSKDNSVKIAREYEQKFPNIFKVIDKENGGHGSTINAGLKVATGKYFKVVDADDWVDTENFRKLVERLKDVESDVIFTNYTMVFEPKMKTEAVKAIFSDVDKEMLIKDCNNVHLCMHAETFKTEIIRDVRLQEHCFYVDVEYNNYAIARCKTVTCMDLDIYQYRIGRAGQSVSPQGFYKHRDNHLTVLKNLFKFYETADLEEYSRVILFNNIVNMLHCHYNNYTIFYHIDKKPIVELVEFDKWLESYPKFYEESNKYKIVRGLRKHHFKNAWKYNRIYLIKKFIKKLIGKV